MFVSVSVCTFIMHDDKWVHCSVPRFPMYYIIARWCLRLMVLENRQDGCLGAVRGYSLFSSSISYKCQGNKNIAYLQVSDQCSALRLYV